MQISKKPSLGQHFHTVPDAEVVKPGSEKEDGTDLYELPEG